MFYTNHHKVTFFDRFPNITAREFDSEAYEKYFDNSTIVVKAKGKDVYYPTHWGVLSVKCAFNGTEYYEQRGCVYAVSDHNFLIFNHGSHRSSFIESEQEVESFTISFSPVLESEVVYGLIRKDEHNLDNPYDSKLCMDYKFTEKLYQHNSIISPLIFRLRESFDSADTLNVNETVIDLLEGLYVNQCQVWTEMQSMNYAKPSTKKELYERLNRGKDYIASNYKEDLSLELIAEIACLNRYYFLREFKKLFRITPYQYLQKLRMEEANRLLKTSKKRVSDVCREIGFSDIASFSKLYKKIYHISPSMDK